MDQSAASRIALLFEQWSGEKIISITQLPPSGSYRFYFRITGKTKRVLGAINHDIKENIAFIEFSRFFLGKNLPVPQIYAVSPQKDCYLLQDLGDTTLFDLLSNTRTNDTVPSSVIDIYHKAIDKLIDFQLIGRELDYSYCYPRGSFDKQSMMWDLHYFKYYFLKLARISFDEQLLEDDFNQFADYLLQTDCNYFMFRDFQSRNIMVTNGEPVFIDYQGGRKGALQYDLASLLYDAKADLSQENREELLNYYIQTLRSQVPVDAIAFKNHYFGYVLIRIMQAMGAYGFRGFYEKKDHFLKSIPYALKNLRFMLENYEMPIKLPSLQDALRNVVNSEMLMQISTEPELTLTITSFSYKRGIPLDYSGHGGGFVFDCRAMHNPGKYDEFKTKTGRDPEVIAFFEKQPDIQEFINNIFLIVDQSVEKYLIRNFKHLMFSFGCTGGQHRSVYCAERLAAHLRAKYSVKIKLNHVEREMAELTKST